MKRVLARFAAPAVLLVFAVTLLWVPHFFVNVSQSTLILTLTFFAVLWYTWETRKMQEAVTKQTHELVYQRRLSILPNLSVGFTRKNVFASHDIVECLELRNIGNGAAVNIEVDDVRVRYAENAFARIRFDRFVFLEPNRDNSPTQKFAHLRIFVDNEALAPEDPSEFATWVIPSEFCSSPVSFLREHNKEDKITLVLRFQDVDGLRYEQSAAMHIDGNRLRPSKIGRVTMATKI